MKSAITTSLLFTVFLLLFMFIFSPYRCVNSLTQSKYLYVSHITGTIVTVIDRETNKVVDTIRAGNGPVWTASKPGGEFLYIANFNSNDVTVYNKISGEITATVPAGLNPAYVTASPDGKYILISHQSTDGMWILNTESNTIEKKT